MNGTAALGVLAFAVTIGAATAQARQISFKSCGGTVKSVQMQPCSSEPCAIKRGDTARIDMAFTSNQNSPTLVMVISALLEDDLELPLPMTDSDGCKGRGIQCPLQEGTAYTFNYKLKIQPFYPKMNTTAKLNLTGARGTVACVQFPVRLVD
uniref:Putative secreted protein n=1 Tax=Amblyomma americanum TaxID=6943 RepID=A0A0C9SDR1_AMBAM